MTEKRKDHINRLLHELKALENRVITIKNDDTVPFSFFRESFDKTQEIMRLLHEMKIMQIDDMKHQMERLVLFLSESEARRKAEETKAEETKKAEEERKAEAARKAEEARLAFEAALTATNTSPTTTLEQEPPIRQVYAEKIVLPEYKNPRKTVATISPPHTTDPVLETSGSQAPTAAHTPNYNTPKAAPPSLDLKKHLSLNDRFLFQRELFGNSRTEMDSTIAHLNTFPHYPEAEQYLRENKVWDFETPTVVAFLEAIQKGYK